MFGTELQRWVSGNQVLEEHLQQAKLGLKKNPIAIKQERKILPFLDLEGRGVWAEIVSGTGWYTGL